MKKKKQQTPTQEMLDNIDDFRLRLIMQGSELLKDSIPDLNVRIAKRCMLVDILNKINCKYKRDTAYKFIREVDEYWKINLQ